MIKSEIRKIMTKTATSRAALLHLHRDEAGGITMFVVVMFVVMAVVAGAAIDLARHETARADLQNALDRGVLAAANWTNDVPDAETAENVIRGYMASRQQRDTQFTLNVNSEGPSTNRQISASAEIEVGTIFMNAMGVGTLDVPAQSAAAQSLGLTEVVLVLDVSGSMRWDSSWNSGQSKLDDLKFAAKQFIDTVLDGPGSDRTLISVVPYSAQVALPDEMADLYNINSHHSYSNCVDYDDLDYTSLSISLNDSLDQHEHYATKVEEYEVEVTTLESVPVEREVTREETYTVNRRVLVGYWYFFGFPIPIYDWVPEERTRTVTDTVIEYEDIEVTRVETRQRGIFGCPSENNAIMPYSNNPDALKAAIDGLSPQHYTASSVGMKWAAALLDPGTAPVVNDKINTGIAAFATYTAEAVVGAIASGEGFTGDELSGFELPDDALPSYFNGWPRAWTNTSGRKIVVLMTDGVNTRQERPDATDYANYGADGFNDLDNYTYYSDGSIDKTGILDIYTIVNDESGVDEDGNGPIDRDLLSVCSALKSAGTEANRPIIYTIGFELGSGTSDAIHADRVLRDCASDPSMHYMVEGVSIVDAFSNIGDELKTLKLVN